MSDDKWIETFTGRKFWPLNPNPNDLCIEDIAHALALKCRFAGHCREFYSVAQHSVLMSDFVPKEYRLTALLHDAAEAYLPDFCRPIKPSLSGFKELEHRLMEAVSQKFGILYPLPDAVKKVDDYMLHTEADLLMANSQGWVDQDKVFGMFLTPWTWQVAEKLFLVKFNVFGGGK